MRGFALGIAALLVVGAGGVAAAPKDPEGTDVEAALKKHVAYLAGPELKGRGAWEDRKKAADYVAQAFEKAGFKPLPGRSAYFVDAGGTAEQPEVRNVCAWWPAPPTSAKDVGPYVIVSAHYDHLGVRDGKTYPGADDNASGVAVLLEVARTFAAREALALRTQPLPRALCLVAFDLEEQQLVGSKRFVAEPPVPLAKCELFLTMDQMGRSLADLKPGLLFLMGAEHSAWTARTALNLTVDATVTKAVLGIDFQPPTGYSDYVPFQEKKVPFLFVSTGACGHYHQPGDTPDKLDYPRIAVHTAYVRDLVTLALAAEEPLTWQEPGEPQLDEIRTVRDLTALAVPKMEEVHAPPFLQAAVSGFLKYVDAILERGKVTPAERTAVRNTARTLFQQASLLAPR